MRVRHRNLENRRGVAAVEFGVVLPLICVLLFGTWEVSRLVNVQQVMSNAAREAGRQASTGVKTQAQIKQVAVDYLAKNNIVITASQVTISNLTQPSVNDPRDASQLDRFRVVVTVPIASVRWLSPGFFRFSGDLTTSSDWYSMKDVPLLVPTTLPVE